MWDQWRELGDAPKMNPPVPRKPPASGIERKDDVRALRQQIEATGPTSFRENEGEWKRVRDEIIARLPYSPGPPRG